MPRFARMKEGFRPIVLNGCTTVPEYPTYWPIPTGFGGAIELLVHEGHIEYRPDNMRPPEPDLQLLEVNAPPAAPAANKFSRKRS